MNGIPVANADSTGTASTIAYVTADQLGTPRAIADQTGTTVWQWAYQGNAWSEQSPTSNGYTYNVRFPGQYFDAESGMVSNGFRDCYEPATGRYCQPDPTGYDGGQWSWYAYGNNNPLSRMDPLGLQETEESEEEIEALRESLNPKLGPNMADPMNRNIIQEESEECPASGFRGSRGSPFRNALFQPRRNLPETIDGVNYTGRALDQRQNRGIMPSVVQNALSTGESYETGTGTSGYYDPVNNVRVITSDQTGSVVTVIPGAPPGWK